MKRQQKIHRLWILALSGLLISCSDSASKGGTTSGNPLTPEDSSTTGVVAEAVGGALTSSNPNGSSATLKSSPMLRLAGSAHVNTASSCPTYRSGSGAGCSASSTTLWLDDNECSYGDGSVWDGVQALSTSGASVACGTFPNPGANGTLDMQYVTAVSSTTPGSILITSTYGTQVEVNDSANNLDNFNGTTIAPIVNGGYGDSVGFNSSGARASLTVDHQIYAMGLYNHSITGTLTINETAGATSRTVTGSVSVYHNLLKVIGVATFNNVVHQDSCCLPVSGSISTTFHQGSSSPTAEGQLYVGQTETLTFTGCGTATLQTYSGTAESVTLSRCF